MLLLLLLLQTKKLLKNKIDFSKAHLWVKTMDENKEITLTLLQLVKVMNLRPVERMKFWIYLKKDLSVTDIIDRIENPKKGDPK